MSKNKFLALIFLLFLSVLFTSCEDEPIDPAFNSVPVNNGGGGNGGGVVTTFSVKATKDGVLKQWNIGIATYFKSLKSFTILASDVATNITISIDDPSKIGIYPYSFKTNCVYFENEIFYSTTYSADEYSIGNITVTDFDETNKTIKGTFNFTAKDDNLEVSKIFNQGEFSVKYIEQ
ncbi:DUF6252 family protein [Flavobacterium myungsuense]|uniref:DUF6252 family protein n=1 Tax=Flavobacterium myungsuense TaxID=651823 RepID=A0ABW3J1Z3_9FLAO